MIHQPMAGDGGLPGEAGRHNQHAVVAGAVFTSFMACVQIGFVLNFKTDRFQRGQALPDQGDAVGGF